MKRRVVATGLGVISPLGNDIKIFWDNLVKGRSGISKLTAFDPTGFSSQIAGEARDFDPSLYMEKKEVKRTARFVQFAVAAARQALADSKINLEQEDPNRIGVLVGSGIGSLKVIEDETRRYLEKGPRKISPFLIPTLIVNEAAGWISIIFKLKGPTSCVATACATGNHAIGDAFRIIQRGDADVMICGGTESAITPLGVGGFCALKALSSRNDTPETASRPFDKDRDGFVISEGAGIVVLELLEHAQKRSAPIYCELVGYGMSSDAYHVTAPDPTADGPSRAIKIALDDANLKPEDVNYINAHGTSTILNDRIETKAIKIVFGDYAKRIAVSSTKSMTGHLLGGAGGVEFIALSFSIRDGIVPPTINYHNPDPECDLDYVPNEARRVNVQVGLSNALGFGGHNATLAAKKFSG
ncbi:MAG: beta-ketoacyl-ACP synthase II [Candidatus Omnitrophica bacterium]|nr:beta-ketoacyl-ACP synthase II [Candidatus Omnitrophota bacterium]